MIVTSKRVGSCGGIGGATKTKTNISTMGSLDFYTLEVGGGMG